MKRKAPAEMAPATTLTILEVYTRIAQPMPIDTGSRIEKMESTMNILQIPALRLCRVTVTDSALAHLWIIIATNNAKA